MLSIELFLVIRTMHLTDNAAKAGVLFTIYSLAQVFTNLFYIKFPTLLHGNPFRVALQYFLATGLSIGGFIVSFSIDSYSMLIISLIVIGYGTCCWTIIFESTSNLAFPKEQLQQLAFMRQLFEAIGFLVPGVCVTLVKFFLSNGVASDNKIIETSSKILGGTSFLFVVLSFDQVFSKVSNIRYERTTRSEGEAASSILGDLKVFFGTSIILYFMIYALFLAMSNMKMGTLSLVTEHYFGLDGTFLGIHTIALPVGGMFMSIWTLSQKSLPDDKSTIFKDSLYLFLLLATMIALSSLTPIPNETVAKILLILEGFISGAIFCRLSSSALSLWYYRLKQCDPMFVTRATIINDIGQQVIMAVCFQLQTLLLEKVVVGNIEPFPVINSLAFFMPQAILCMFITLLTRFLKV